MDATGETRASAVRAPLPATGLAEPHHDGSELYVDRVGDFAELRLRAPADAADAVLLRYVRDGETRAVDAQRVGGAGREVWWRAELPLRNPVVSYRWLLSGGQLGYRWLNSAGLQASEVPPTDDFRLTADAGGPPWHLSSVAYEIFVDRFAASGARHPAPAWAVPRDWGRLPEQRSRMTNREVFGGDLAGIEQRLDHVASLGADVLWLTPFFPAESNHGYDPTSWEHVDPRLGGDEALASLLRAAHGRGMRVIGDLSLDHCSAAHEWFVRAQTDPEGDERSFFLFDRSETHGYLSWLGTEFPRFDWRSPCLRARMGEVVQRWRGAGLDGWRIGAATLVGRHADVDLNAEVARWLRGQVEDGLLVGEYWHDFQPDLDGRGWHGVMNYAGFLRPVWWWLRDAATRPDVFDIFSAAPAPSYGGRDLAGVMQSFRTGVPWEALLHSWTMLDTHDTPRFRTVAGSRERQLVGVGLQMTMPGVPLIFAGSELGLEGGWGQDARRTMPWEEPNRWDERLLREYRRLVMLRRSSEALARGGLRVAHVDDDAIVYLRETRRERILCLAARAGHAPVSVPFGQLETLYGDDAPDGVLPAHGPAFHVWRIEGG
jgi:alpha-glucosidase